jgi:FkbM family methyltransferase
VHRFEAVKSDDARYAAMLAAHKINLVLDVGANCGQYALGLRDSGYLGRIVSFEPQSQAHRELLAAASRDPNWTAAERTAIGASRSTLEINVSANSVSSSLLPMLDSHSRVAPESAYIGTETVDVVPLDEIAPNYIRPGDRAFLKIDVQGYEASVLDGAAETLKKVVGVATEMSFTPLYEGQSLFPDLYDRLTALGFAPWALLPGFSDNVAGRMLQCDGVFFRDIRSTNSNPS